jgi:5-methylcytosine-specific restriction endonuclease McrA
MGRKKIYTDEELKERRRQQNKEYRAKPEVKQYMKEYSAKPEVKQYKKEYRAKPEVKQYMKEYRAKPEVKQYKKEYRAKPEVKQYMKEYSAKPEVKQYKKEYNATPEAKQRVKEYRATPEAKQRVKEYRATPERKRYMYRQSCVRRSKGGYVSNIERQLIYERDAYKCAYHGCNKVVIVGAISSNPLQATIDHIIPISKGGLSIYSNMITMCRGCNCNTKKAGRLSDESRLMELAHDRNIEFGLVDSKAKWEKGQQDDRVAGMGGWLNP